MIHHSFPNQLHLIYLKTLERYHSGDRDLGGYFTPEEQAFLNANGVSPQSLYDYAEDEANYGEPGWNQALTIELIRRDYFINSQQGHPSPTRLEAERLPSKTASVRGIEWLPRLIPKAKAKLKGELPSSLMYGCGGDRRFFKQHNILPAEFLSLVWRHENDDNAIIAWVEQRSSKQA